MSGLVLRGSSTAVLSLGWSHCVSQTRLAEINLDEISQPALLSSASHSLHLNDFVVVLLLRCSNRDEQVSGGSAVFVPTRGR